VKKLTLYLLNIQGNFDTVSQNPFVKLRFYNASTEQIEEFKDYEYKPYFFVPYPLSDKEKEIVQKIHGKVEVVKKRDLYSNEWKEIAKVKIQDPKLLRKVNTWFEKVWESEIDFGRGYAYDKGLVFGAPYILAENRFTPVLDISEELKRKFEAAFSSVKLNDPLKYSQLEQWFMLLHQPIPQIEPKNLDIKEEIDSEKHFLAFMLARIATIPVTEAYHSRHVSDWIKSMIYAYLRKNDFLIPTSAELRHGETPHVVPGALTVAPKSGMYFNTVVCDFESLYPSCIDSYNLSYETVDCGHEECKTNKIEGVNHHICLKRRGFYSVLIGALKDLRIHWFKPLSKNPFIPEKERKQAETAAKLLKLITVSSYGVTVRIHGVACPPLAECITGCGRYALQTTWNMAEENGLRPVYGDTDSIFLDNASLWQVEWLIRTVKEKLRLDLAVEKHYSICVLPKAKKAYFGILPNGTPDLKGLTAIKSNSPNFIQQVFQDCVKELAQVKNFEEFRLAKRRIVAIVQQAIRKLGERKVELKDLIYSVQLYFDPNQNLPLMKTLHQPYQCALQLMDAGVKLNRRDVVRFVKVKPFNYKGKTFTVKPIEHIKSLSEINFEDYVRNLIMALNQTFSPMGIELEAKAETKITDWLKKT
jgi:DNA polymerase elongation subunit (family B)